MEPELVGGTRHALVVCLRCMRPNAIGPARGRDVDQAVGLEPLSF